MTDAATAQAQSDATEAALAGVLDPSTAPAGLPEGKPIDLQSIGIPSDSQDLAQVLPDLAPRKGPPPKGRAAAVPAGPMTPKELANLLPDPRRVKVFKVDETGASSEIGDYPVADIAREGSIDSMIRNFLLATPEARKLNRSHGDRYAIKLVDGNGNIDRRPRGWVKVSATDDPEEPPTTDPAELAKRAFEAGRKAQQEADDQARKRSLELDDMARKRATDEQAARERLVADVQRTLTAKKEDGGAAMITAILPLILPHLLPRLQTSLADPAFSPPAPPAANASGSNLAGLITAFSPVAVKVMDMLDARDRPSKVDAELAELRRQLAERDRRGGLREIVEQTTPLVAAATPVATALFGLVQGYLNTAREERKRDREKLDAALEKLRDSHQGQNDIKAAAARIEEAREVVGAGPGKGGMGDFVEALRLASNMVYNWAGTKAGRPPVPPDHQIPDGGETDDEPEGAAAPPPFPEAVPAGVAAPVRALAAATDAETVKAAFMFLGAVLSSDREGWGPVLLHAVNGLQGTGPSDREKLMTFAQALLQHFLVRGVVDEPTAKQAFDVLGKHAETVLSWASQGGE